MQKDRISILYLDDDEDNLISFKANYRKSFDIFTVTKPNDAIAILEQNEIHVVLSDQRMPELSGVEFFELLLIQHPDPIRILVTGFSDLDAIIAAINDGDVYKYIKKPWDRAELKIEVESAYQLYIARKEAKETLEELDLKKKELEKFVYSASHDFRAPLSSILGLLKISKHEENAAQRETYHNLMEESVKDLDYFIQNIINFYQNQTAAVAPSLINFDQLIGGIIENANQINATKQVVISTDIQQYGPFFSDEKLINTIISNILSNSILYSDDEKDVKKAKISIITDEQGAKISISDNGIGIKNTRDIFDLFIKDSKKRGFGAGLGLYVSKVAIHKIGGNVDITSNFGKGTTINLNLPNLTAVNTPAEINE